MRRHTFIFLLWVVPALLFAQGNTAGSSYLKLPTSARSAALGESLVAEAGNLSASMFNPALLALKTNTELQLTHAEWIQQVQFNHFTGSIPYPFGTFSIAVSSTAIDDIEVRDKPGPAVSTFTARATSAHASFGTLMGTNIALGFGAKVLYEKYYINETTGVAFDAGLVYLAPLDGLTAAISLTHFGSMSQLKNERSDLPTQTRFGAAYRTRSGPFSILVSSQVSNEIESVESRIHFGAEIMYDQSVSLALGYQTGYETRGVSGGVGFLYDVLRLDYAYVPFSLGLGDAHLITIRFNL